MILGHRWGGGVIYDRGMEERRCPRPIGFARGPRVADLAGRGPFALSVGGVDLVAVRVQGALRVFEGRCPHQGALLGEGTVEEGDLVCRNHGWRFDVDSGRRLGGSGCLRTCPAREVDGQLWVDVAAISAAAPAQAAVRASAPARPRPLDSLPGPRGLPFLGNALQVDIAVLHRQLEAWAAEHGTPYRWKAGPRTGVSFADPDMIAEALRARPERFRRPGRLAPVFRELGIRGVFSAEGAEWRPLRRLGTETLSQRTLRGFYPTIAKVARRLERRWERAAARGSVVAIGDDLARFTVDVTTCLAFGQDVNTLEQGDDVLQRRLELVLPAVNRRMSAIVPTWRVVRSPSDRRLDRALADLRAFLGRTIAAARARTATAQERAGPPENLLEAMLVASDEEGARFSDEVIFGNAMTTLLAGSDTTAHALAWAVHELCDAPGEIAAVRAELAAAGIDGVPPDLEAAQRLARAGAIASETLRLRSVAPVIFLEPTGDEVLGGVALPRGTMVGLLVRLPGLSAENFADPMAFRPLRWLEPVGAHQPGTVFAFGSGPRMCPGRSLAFIEMKVALATLLVNFDLERVGRREEVRERFQSTMVPDGLRVRLRPRAGPGSRGAA
jgi:cytochrome P450/nitrite reductase/ring-hydroxylating ferredoxin subunit